MRWLSAHLQVADPLNGNIKPSGLSWRRPDWRVRQMEDVGSNGAVWVCDLASHHSEGLVAFKKTRV